MLHCCICHFNYSFYYKIGWKHKKNCPSFSKWFGATISDVWPNSFKGQQNFHFVLLRSFFLNSVIILFYFHVPFVHSITGSVMCIVSYIVIFNTNCLTILLYYPLYNKSIYWRLNIFRVIFDTLTHHSKISSCILCYLLFTNSIENVFGFYAHNALKSLVHMFEHFQNKCLIVNLKAYL